MVYCIVMNKPSWSCSLVEKKPNCLFLATKTEIVLMSVWNKMMRRRARQLSNLAPVLLKHGNN